MTVFTSTSPEATIRIGEKIARNLREGTVITLTGPLGCGKTVLVKGIGKGLNIDEEITSPSFTIISNYHGDKELYHIDLYRINHPDEFEQLGLEDILYSGAITVIEWGEKAAGLLPEETITINFKIERDQKRIISITEMSN
ncbi:MAG: tRNA (adenosine(37)-N6)-threonylcarbamoyltransferase complex ATPase subunit type 1 TsaE [Spirochaetes bacterium]|nr:tRNA (adenosine(37)-N6)-threonylcarbamoyltransferase complex ATPase subunit type 1 TsaE [Spirochaetota bacterium]